MHLFLNYWISRWIVLKIYSYTFHFLRFQAHPLLYYSGLYPGLFLKIKSLSEMTSTNSFIQNLPPKPVPSSQENSHCDPSLPPPSPASTHPASVFPAWAPESMPPRALPSPPKPFPWRSGASFLTANQGRKRLLPFWAKERNKYVSGTHF